MICPKCEQEIQVPALPFTPGARFVCPICGHGYVTGYIESQPYIQFDAVFKVDYSITIAVGVEDE